MAEPVDTILPILQRIQTDIAALRKSFAAQEEKLREMNGYLSFNLGITARHSFEIEDLRKEGEAIKQRLRSLETHA